MASIFTKIINRELPAEIVYEDDVVLAFMDINPVNKGHVLVITKNEYPMMPDVPDQEIQHAFVKAKHVMSGIQQTTQADFVQVGVVGVDVPHFHIHLIPRYKHDNLSSWPTKEYTTGEIASYAQQIRNAIQNI